MLDTTCSKGSFDLQYTCLRTTSRSEKAAMLQSHPHDLQTAHTRHKTLDRLHRFLCDEIYAPAATGVRPPRVRLLVKFFERGHLREARAKLLPIDSPQPIVPCPKLGYAEVMGGFREQADVYAILRGSRGEFIWMRSEKAAMVRGLNTRAPAPPSTLLLASCLSEYAHTLDSLPTAKIYEEALRLKLGGEGKIRIVCHVVDGLCSDRAHMRTLLDRILDKNFSKTAEQLGRKTLYLHVTSKHCGRLPIDGTYPNLEKKDDNVDLITTPRKKERLEGAPAPR
ncbi:hypothetical protein BD310DRAFT_953074 [Dichomitus squalens]|uniref:Uncharacterized protein n=1 Tax=Dichomitus squalens TaxID=114155 RepID=A0A4Q9PAS7_9APHY|nr:hypothetical protein BD310DRAFT_953074 [Dichomitus squalens]